MVGEELYFKFLNINFHGVIHLDEFLCKGNWSQNMGPTAVGPTAVGPTAAGANCRGANRRGANCRGANRRGAKRMTTVELDW